MKKILALFLAAGIMAASVAGCAGSQMSAPDDSSITDSDMSDESSEYEKRKDLADYTIGISVDSLRGSFMNVFRISFMNRIKKLGFKEANISIYENNGDTALELRMIDLLIESGVQQLLVCPNENADISLITDKAVAAGIPLVYFDCVPDEAERTRWTDNNWKVTCVGPDNSQLGELQAVLASGMGLSQLDINKNGSVDYIMIEGSADSPLSEINRNSFTDKMVQEGVPVRCLNDSFANDDRDEAYSIMQSDLATFGSGIELVVCHSDIMALGAMLAIQEADRIVSSDIFLIGAEAETEAIENIEKATMTGSVFKDGTALAAAVILNMINNIDGLKNETVTHMEYVLVTAANADKIKGIIEHPL